MGKLIRKIHAKIDRRHAGFKQMCENAEKRSPGSSKGYTRPGSRNPKKQG